MGCRSVVCFCSDDISVQSSQAKELFQSQDTFLSLFDWLGNAWSIDRSAA